MMFVSASSKDQEASNNSTTKQGKYTRHKAHTALSSRKSKCHSARKKDQTPSKQTHKHALQPTTQGTQANMANTKVAKVSPFRAGPCTGSRGAVGSHGLRRGHRRGFAPSSSCGAPWSHRTWSKIVHRQIAHATNYDARDLLHA